LLKTDFEIGRRFIGYFFYTQQGEGWMKRKFLAGFLLICSVVFLSAPAMAAFTNVVAFGDSISDNGTNASAGDFYGFGVYTNGTPWVDRLAALHGASIFNVAFGGATTGWGNIYETPLIAPSTGSSVPTNFSGLQWQVNDLGIQTAIGGMTKDSTLFTVWAGANDYNRMNAMNTYNKFIDPTTPDLTAADKQAAALNAVNNIMTALGTLDTMGAKHILVPNLMLLGDGNFAVTYNTALEGALAAFASSFDGTVYTLDIFSLYFRMFAGYDIQNEDPEIAAAAEAQAMLDGLIWSDGYHPGYVAHAAMAWAAFNAPALVPAPVPLPGAMVLMASGCIALLGFRRKRTAA